ETAYQPNPEMLDIQALVEEIVEKSRKSNPEAQINVDAQLENPYIFADKSGMTSVAQNLIENAIKYSNKPAQIDLHLVQQNGHINWAIADQGIGVSDQEKKRIFKRFYRVGNEDTRKTKGTGLGLYIVNEIIKAHQGSIQIVDNQPKGSIFKIKLPHKQNDQP
ncbi:MAG: HAMP domain-containing sensor histidine kinase, partial [Bacteroidota bacterium]